MMRYIVIVLLIGIVLIAALSCGKKGVPPDGSKPFTKLEIVSGNQQTGAAFSYLTDSLVVRVVSSVGLPVAGDTVWFEQITPINGGRFFYTEPRLTNINGVAYNFYRLDSLVGADTVKVTAASVGDTGAVLFAFTVGPGAADSIFKVSSQTAWFGIAGQVLPDSFVVGVIDTYGNIVPGAKVIYKTNVRSLVVTDSSAQQPFDLDTAVTYTDANGLARADWILTVNPDSNLGYPYGYPNARPELKAFIAPTDSVLFRGVATNPGQLKYYYDIRSIFEANCFTCHSGLNDYRLDFYYEMFRNGNLIPGDSSSKVVKNVDPIIHRAGNINFVEEDKVIRWVVVDSAAPGSSGLNNYTDHMKPIFDNGCIDCHGGATPAGSYDLTTHLGIRGAGSDAVPNAIPGDNLSLLVTRMVARHNVDSLSSNPVTAAALADSIIRWVVTDSLRDH